MRVIGLVTSLKEAKELEYIAKVRTVVERVQLLAMIGKARKKGIRKFRL